MMQYMIIRSLYSTTLKTSSTTGDPIISIASVKDNTNEASSFLEKSTFSFKVY